MEKGKIYEEAEKIAQKYNPDSISPFPYEKVQEEHKDLAIIFSDKLPEGISGAIFYNKENSSEAQNGAEVASSIETKQEPNFIILISTQKPFTRQHFTIAHELGHYFLHQDIIKSEESIVDGEGSLDGSKMLFRLDNAEYSRVETEANNFAAALIMPTALVIKAWKTLKSIEEVAKVFNVSPSAMSIRLEKLGLIG
jgi:Zn-dependent peptidase ImmA (M78 family)